MLTVLSEESEILDAQTLMQEQLESGATKTGDFALGFHGGTAEALGGWYEGLNFYFGMNDAPGRYWNAFGFGNPFRDRPDIVVEVNPPHHGIDRRVAGGFAFDDDDNIYLFHRGILGGGREGIGKEAFLNTYPELLETVDDEDRLSEVVVVGIVGSDKFVEQLHHFTRVVKSFKDRVAGPRVIRRKRK